MCKMQDLYIFIVGLFQFFFDEVTSTPTYKDYRKGNGSVTTLTKSEDTSAISRIDCGVKCRLSNCHAFHFEGSSQLCKLVTFNYIDTSLTTGVGDNAFYYADEVFSVSNQPFLDCPSTSDGNVTALTSSLQFTFRITLATVTQTQAWATCRDAGETLMKIETVEKQAAVQYIVSTCPDLSSHDFWLDGYNDPSRGWVYDDGTSVPMDNTHLWAPTAPNGFDWDCVRLRSASGHRWDDFSCSSKYSYICEPA